MPGKPSEEGGAGALPRRQGAEDVARFLLRNAAVLENLYCGFAEGPHRIQMELMREMEGWVVSELANKEFC